ncbi:MAG: type I 3-dehydroquinate dehydratase [Erysipelotrichaceae bacterium]
MDKKEIRKQLKQRKLPFIATPFIAHNEAALLEECKLWKRETSDIIEWRIDCFDNYKDSDALLDMYERLRCELADAIIMVTLRTQQQGGKGDVSEEEYIELLSALCACDIDLLDIEDSNTNKTKQALIELCSKQGIISILSYHDFNKSETTQQIEKRFLSMAEFDADILKVAYMANNEKDVESLMEATKNSNEKVEQAIISISMGEMGKASRFDAYQYGSILTFAFLKDASAPGQISLKEMKEYYKSHFN